MLHFKRLVTVRNYNFAFSISPVAFLLQFPDVNRRSLSSNTDLQNIPHLENHQYFMSSPASSLPATSLA